MWCSQVSRSAVDNGVQGGARFGFSSSPTPLLAVLAVVVIFSSRWCDGGGEGRGRHCCDGRQLHMRNPGLVALRQVRLWPMSVGIGRHSQPGILNFPFSYFYFLVFLFGNMVYRKVNMCCFVGVLWMWWQDLDNKILSNAIKGKLSFSLVYLFKFFIMFVWF